MRILVAVKRVIDPYVKIRIKSDHSGVETQNVKMAMNPFDEIAVEEALKWKEKGWASEVLAVSIGDASCQETLRHALALGADRAIHIQTDESHCSLNLAKIFAHITKEEMPGLILMGKQSIDGDNNQTPQMLAALLDWPQATYASKMDKENGHVQVTREVDGGLETLSVALPAVISADLRLNTPRYATLPNIMKAKTKPLITQTLASLGLTLKPHMITLAVKAPSVRQGGVKVASVEALVDKLCNEARVI